MRPQIQCLFAALGAILLLAAPVGARADDTLCTEFSQADMRDCLRSELDKSGRALALAEKRMAAALAHWDENAHLRAQARASQRGASAAFARFRTAQCQFDAALGGGAIGAALASRRLRCAIALNLEQARRLRALAPHQ